MRDDRFRILHAIIHAALQASGCLTIAILIDRCSRALAVSSADRGSYSILSCLTAPAAVFFIQPTTLAERGEHHVQ
jgi:hypothetical protein